MNGPADITYYLELQSRIFDVLRYVSYDSDNFGTFSIKLESLFVDVCSFLDSLCQTYIRELGGEGHKFKEEGSVGNFTEKMGGSAYFNFGDYRLLLEGDFLLSGKEVALNPYEGGMHFPPSASAPRLSIRPFTEWAKKKSPGWWEAFTKLKHDRLANPKESTLKNVIDSLAGTYMVLTLRNEQEFKTGGVNPEVYHLFMPKYWNFHGMVFKGQPQWK